MIEIRDARRMDPWLPPRPALLLPAPPPPFSPSPSLAAIGAYAGDLLALAADFAAGLRPRLRQKEGAQEKKVGRIGTDLRESTSVITRYFSARFSGETRPLLYSSQIECGKRRPGRRSRTPRWVVLGGQRAPASLSLRTAKAAHAPVGLSSRPFV